MSELKSCPFCGNEVEVEKIPLWHGNGHGYSGCYEFKIKCESCGCTVNQPKNDSIYRSEEKARENAIEAWNKRTEKNEDGKTYA
jgi:Lar family restriction alleviation protein